MMPKQHTGIRMQKYPFLLFILLIIPRKPPEQSVLEAFGMILF